jgi:hypothetical protein
MSTTNGYSSSAPSEMPLHRAEEVKDVRAPSTFESEVYSGYSDQPPPITLQTYYSDGARDSIHSIAVAAVVNYEHPNCGIADMPLSCLQRYKTSSYPSSLLLMKMRRPSTPAMDCRSMEEARGLRWWSTIPPRNWRAFCRTSWKSKTLLAAKKGY